VIKDGHLIFSSLNRLGLEQVQVRVVAGTPEGLLQVRGVLLVRGHGQLEIKIKPYEIDQMTNHLDGLASYTNQICSMSFWPWLGLV